MNTLAQQTNVSPFERLNSLMEELWPSTSIARGVWNPAVDIREENDRIVFVADLPGLNREDLDVQLIGDTLVIQGKRESDKEEKKEGYLRRERSFGSFYRSFKLDYPASTDQVKAEYKNGLLTVTIQKAEPTKTQRVSVQ